MAIYQSSSVYLLVNHWPNKHPTSELPTGKKHWKCTYPPFLKRALKENLCTINFTISISSPYSATDELDFSISQYKFATMHRLIYTNNTIFWRPINLHNTMSHIVHHFNVRSGPNLRSNNNLHETHWAKQIYVSQAKHFS